MLDYGKSVFLSADIDFAHARIARNHREIFKWCRQNTLIDKDQQDEWSYKISNDGKIKMFSVQKLTAQAIGPDTSGVLAHQIGVCGLTSIDHLNQTAEFSLWIDTPHTRRGHGKDALYCLFRHGFEDFNLNRIWGETYDGNKALDLFLEMGMKIEGIQRQAYFREGKFIDAILVSMLRSEWKN